jgi:hypothetical protein
MAPVLRSSVAFIAAHLLSLPHSAAAQLCTMEGCLLDKLAKVSRAAADDLQISLLRHMIKWYRCLTYDKGMTAGGDHLQQNPAERWTLFSHTVKFY